MGPISHYRRQPVASGLRALAAALDARDDLGAGPVALIVDPLLSLNNPNNLTHTAGTTFMLKVESGGLFEDLPRDGSHAAIIADPRNDENLIIAGVGSRLGASDIDRGYCPPFEYNCA